MHLANSLHGGVQQLRKCRGGVRQTLSNRSKGGKPFLQKRWRRGMGGGGVQINEKNTYVILERPLWIVKLAMLNFFSPCRVHLKTCYGCVLDVIVFVFIVISSFVVYFLLEMCPYTVHLPPVFSFFWVPRFSNNFRKAFPYWYEYIVFFMNNLLIRGKHFLY